MDVFAISTIKGEFSKKKKFPNDIHVYSLIDMHLIEWMSNFSVSGGFVTIFQWCCNIAHARQFHYKNFFLSLAAPYWISLWHSQRLFRDISGFPFSTISYFQFLGQHLFLDIISLRFIIYEKGREVHVFRILTKK